VEPAEGPPSILREAVEEEAIHPDLDPTGAKAGQRPADHEDRPAGRDRLQREARRHPEDGRRQRQVASQPLHDVPAHERPGHEQERRDEIQDAHARIGLCEIALDRRHE